MNTQKQAAPAPVLVALAIGVAAAGAGFFLFMGSTNQKVEASKPAVAVQPAAPAPMPAPVPQPIEASVEPVAAEVEPPGSQDAPKKTTRLARDLEREQIWTALGRKHNLKPAAPGSAAPSESAAALLPTLDPQYVRDTIREQLVPVAVDCYNTVLRQDPKAGGKLILKFTIVGDEEIGGVVEAAEIDEESTLDSEFLRECLRESVMTVTFDPPPDGGRVEVTYPLTFEPE